MLQIHGNMILARHMDRTHHHNLSEHGNAENDAVKDVSFAVVVVATESFLASHSKAHWYHVVLHLQAAIVVSYHC